MPYADPHMRALYMRDYFAKNPDKSKARHVRDKSARNKRDRARRALDPGAENRRLRDWKKNNPAKVAAAVARRHAKKLKATPAWANRAAILVMYEKAAEWTFEVDHVVPLQSPLVCGLHCEANLQLLNPDENKNKSNLTWPDMP